MIKLIKVTKLEIDRRASKVKEVPTLLNPAAIVSVEYGARPDGGEGSYITMLADRRFVVKESAVEILKANPTVFGPLDAYSTE